MSKNTFNFRKAPEIEKLTLLLPSFWVLVLKYYFEYTIKYVLCILGMMIFLFGLIINIDSDRRLRNLRSSVEKTEKSRYKIPHGGLFTYVSAANYFGEICEWWGFALAAK